MTYVVTLQDLTPPVRYDELPWTEALIGESGTSTGPFNTIATVSLTPVDTDPSNPQQRNLTSTGALLSSGWYLPTWQDAAGLQSPGVPQEYPPPAVQALPPYCSVIDVQYRNAARPITPSSLPNIAQVQSFIGEVAAEINAILVNKGYDIPINSASNPDAFATLHALNVTGAHVLAERSAPSSPNIDRAQKAWDAAKDMLNSASFTLNAPMDQLRSEPRGPWITTHPTGRTFDPTVSVRRGSPRDPYFSRQMRW
jgi:hypothetical protein